MHEKGNHTLVVCGQKARKGRMPLSWKVIGLMLQHADIYHMTCVDTYQLQALDGRKNGVTVLRNCILTT